MIEHYRASIINRNEEYFKLLYKMKNEYIDETYADSEKRCDPKELPFVLFSESLVESNANIYSAQVIETLPRVSSNVPIDCISKYCQQDIHNEIYADKFVEEDSLQSINSKCIEAAKLLSEKFPFWYNNVFIHCKYICINKDEDDKKFYSASWRTEIGKIGLLNPDCANIYEILEAFIHESVHSLFYTMEFFDERIDLRKIEVRKKIRSPWSNNLLRLNSFIHANYVWYSLFHFWNNYLKVFPNDEYVKERIIYIKNGFNNYTLHEVFSAPELSTIRKVITEIQNEIINT